MKTFLMQQIKLPLKAFIIGVCISIGSAQSQILRLPENLISFNSTDGEKLLLESKSRQDYWSLSIQFVTQNNQAYCGVASMVMVLNALGITAPVDLKYAPYNVFTQDNFFNSEKTKAVISPELVSRQGMTLDQMGELLASYSVNVKVYHASDTTLDEFRKLAVENLKAENNFIIVNYLRKAIGQETGGHISPLAAYNEQTDRFLVLDVSRYKYPPVWVKASDLWQAMATVDSSVNKTRGFVLVSKF